MKEAWALIKPLLSPYRGEPLLIIRRVLIEQTQASTISSSIVNLMNFKPS